MYINDLAVGSKCNVELFADDTSLFDPNWTMMMLFIKILLKCVMSVKYHFTNLSGKLESVQYSAALAVTGAWRGTSREKLYTELGWESLSSRRFNRRFTLFYKFVNNICPKYTVVPIPPITSRSTAFATRMYLMRLNARTEKFELTFYSNCLSEWNKLESKLRLAPSIAAFKKKLLSIIFPPAKSVYGIHDPKGLSHLTQLRAGLSKFSFYKFKHDFRDTVSLMCPTSDVIEDTEHFMLLCPSFNAFDVQRQDLLARMVKLLRPFVQVIDLSNDALAQLLLYSDQDLSYDLNNNIHKLTLFHSRNWSL